MSEDDVAGCGLLASFDRLIPALLEASKAYYGPRLISFAIFGSVARRTPGPFSDVDFLVVADPLPHGRTGRVQEFEAVEADLTGQLEELER